MTYDEVLEIENTLRKESVYNIILIKDNDWYRIYEWSAYLACLLRDKVKGSPLKCLHKKYRKLGNGIMVMGIPEKSINESLNKFFPGVEHFEQDGNIIIDTTGYLKYKGFRIDNYIGILEEWKKTIAYDEASQKKDKDRHNLNASANDMPFINTNKTKEQVIDGILKYIVGIDVNYASFIDSWKAILYLKNQVALLGLLE